MKKLPFAALFCAAYLFGAPVAALPIPAVLAGSVAGDVEQAYFLPDDFSLAIELYDFVGSVLPVGTRFGFYFQGAPASLIPIFDVVDQAPPGQSALIDFAGGLVIDADAQVLQAQFVPNANPLGFFIQTFGNDPLLLYSDPTLNPGGIDYFAAYPFLAVPNAYVTGFIASALPAGVPALHLALVSNLHPIPLPSTLLLLLTTSASWGLSRRPAARARS